MLSTYTRLLTQLLIAEGGTGTAAWSMLRASYAGGVAPR